MTRPLAIALLALSLVGCGITRWLVVQCDKNNETPSVGSVVRTISQCAEKATKRAE